MTKGEREKIKSKKAKFVIRNFEIQNISTINHQPSTSTQIPQLRSE
jgi:hypothetical protein